MRFAIPILALVLAGALWWLLSGRGAPEADRAPRPDPAAEDLADAPYLAKGSEALTVWVKDPIGRIPPLAEVGIRAPGGRTRWRNLDMSRGWERFDAPVGRVEVVARAPGYVEATSTVEILPGVLEERVLVLRPEGKTPTTGNSR